MENNISITIRQQDITDDIIDYFYIWYNDMDIVPYFFTNFEGKPVEHLSKDTIKSRMGDKSKLHYVVYNDTTPIGELSIRTNFTGFANPQPHSAWIGICIGNKDYWKRGVGTLAMLFLENECKKLGYQRIELGVFDHNQKAYGLYKKLGYQEIQRTPNFTWHDGVWYDDIRMEKFL